MDDFLQTIAECLAEDGKVAFRGFGAFEVNGRLMLGSIPRYMPSGFDQTKDMYKIVKFKPSELLKIAVNTGVVLPREGCDKHANVGRYGTGYVDRGDLRGRR